MLDISTNPSRTARAYVTARNLFDRLYLVAKLKAFIANLLGQSRELQMLDEINSDGVKSRYILERQAVPMERIIGSEGRSEEYDKEFLPRHRRDRERWVSVAAGMIRNPTQFSPIRVVRVGDDYYIQDGHHRVSVARALNYLFIDADVTVWDFEHEA
ncbi:MAG: hypothetical protein KC496_16810 [Anaerolineae bacterium]|nr:hypothetical protein [Anaerolineae bacterium]